MGMKYIFEVEDETQLIVEIGVNSTGAAVITTKHPKYLTPYEEPDLDAIRKEAYKDGREAGIKDGMCEAWDAARKIVHLQWDGAWAGVDEVEKWFDTYTASEAIEKIRQHEQEQDEIKVGNEVDSKGCRGIITKISYDGDHFNVMWENGSTGYYMIEDFKKTGRHFPKIAEILKKMQEEKE